MNRSSQMLDSTTLKPVDNFNYYDTDSMHCGYCDTDSVERKVTLKQIAFETAIYVTRRNLRGGLHYVR